MTRFSVKDFEKKNGIGVIGFQGNMTKKRMKHRLNSSFGLEPELCKVVWDERIESGYVGPNPRPKHFFFTIHFEKVYATEENNASHVGGDKKAFRKLVWFNDEGIANLEGNVVSEFELRSFGMLIFHSIEIYL